MPYADDAPTESELATHDLQLLSGAQLPAPLGEIPCSPPWLVLSGTAPCPEDRRVAVVGSRRATTLARREAYRLGQELATQGVQVVSGLARGVDRAVLEGALAGGGRPGAVLGNGLPTIYPAEHAALAGRIGASGGFLLSEFPLFARPLPSHFPRRNRLISALGAATVVVQAGLASGSLITAAWALEQGRDVLVYPGPTDTPAFAGSHRLVREGALLVTSPAEVVSALFEELPGMRDQGDAALAVVCADSAQLSLDELLQRTGLSAATLLRAWVRARAEAGESARDAEGSPMS